MKFENRPPGSYGWSECVGHKRILINNAYHSGQFIWKVARHEMFHLSGGQHAGNTDSMNGDNIPTMTTCLGYGQFRTVNALSQDDAAYLNWLHNDLSNHQLHANIGFEQGTSYWGKYNGSMVHYTSGGASSQSHISFYAYGTVNSSYVYQTVRLWTGDDNESYRAKLNARKTSLSHSAQVKARILRKTMTQGSSTCGSYADGITTANDPVITGGYVNLSSSSVSALSGTGWQARESNWVNPANTDGLQLQVRAYAKAETATSGVTRRIYLDNVRGEGT